MVQEIPKVSDRSTKSVILAAHTKALKALSDLEKNPRTVIQQEKNKAAIARVGSSTVEAVVEDLAKTKLLVGATISDLENQLINKRGTLEDIQLAIKAEEETLKDVHGITRSADSFAALVQGQKDQRTAFDIEMSDARVQWSKENAAQTESFNERRTSMNEQFRREREKFEYDFSKEKAESLDNFSVEKKVRLRELADQEATVIKGLREREQSLNAQEAELASLQTQVEGFPTVLQERIASAVEDAKSRAEKSNGFATRALKKDAESAKALSDQAIASLEAQVESLTTERDALRTSVEKSQAEVKSIATEAIKGAQTANYYTDGAGKKAA